MKIRRKQELKDMIETTKESDLVFFFDDGEWFLYPHGTAIPDVFKVSIKELKQMKFHEIEARIDKKMKGDKI